MLTNNGKVILRALLWRYPFGNSLTRFNAWSNVSPELKNHLGESPKQREFLLSTIYSKIPEDLVRFVTGPNTPSDILESLRCGTDVMVCSFPVLLAEKAYAT